MLVDSSLVAFRFAFLFAFLFLLRFLFLAKWRNFVKVQSFVLTQSEQEKEENEICQRSESKEVNVDFHAWRVMDFLFISSVVSVFFVGRFGRAAMNSLAMCRRHRKTRKRRRFAEKTNERRNKRKYNIKEINRRSIAWTKCVSVLCKTKSK